MESAALMGTLKAPNISQVIIERVVNAILSGELEPGQRLPPEDEFAERLGVGKSSVREAMKILEAFGVVEIRRADGTYIVDSFHGSMLSPMIVGMLLEKKSIKDVVGFKTRIQEMIAAELISTGTKDEVSQVAADFTTSVRDAGQSDPEAVADLLDATENALSNLVINPLLAELYRRSIQLSSHCLREALRNQAHDTYVDELFSAYEQLLSALCAGSKAGVASALDAERAILLSQHSAQ